MIDSRVSERVRSRPIRGFAGSNVGPYRGLEEFEGFIYSRRELWNAYEGS